MARKKAAAPKFPRTVETFMDPTWSLNDLVASAHSAPSCFNGKVAIRRYRVTAELIEEPVEVLAERLRGLWRATTNHHDRYPLEGAAKALGITLDPAEWGKDAKRP